jgi:hypothetical protein
MMDRKDTALLISILSNVRLVAMGDSIPWEDCNVAIFNIGLHYGAHDDTRSADYGGIRFSDEYQCGHNTYDGLCVIW